MNTEKHTPKTEPYLTLEDGEYQATSDDGGVTIDRESALGLATVHLRADYAAATKLVEALRECITEDGACCLAHNDKTMMKQRLTHITETARAAIALATGENPD